VARNQQQGRARAIPVSGMWLRCAFKPASNQVHAANAARSAGIYSHTSCAGAVHARRTSRRGETLFVPLCRTVHCIYYSLLPLTIIDVDAYLLSIITSSVFCFIMSVGHESDPRQAPCILGSFDLESQLCWREVSLTIDEIRDVAASRTRCLIAYGILLVPLSIQHPLTKFAMSKVSRRG
jgi:hypothetical protein